MQIADSTTVSPLHSIEGRTLHEPSDPINVPDEDIPAVISSLIDPALVAFDADRDYLAPVSLACPGTPWRKARGAGCVVPRAPGDRPEVDC